MVRDYGNVSIRILKLARLALVIGLLLLTVAVGDGELRSCLDNKSDYLTDAVALGTPSGGRTLRRSCAGLKSGTRAGSRCRIRREVLTGRHGSLESQADGYRRICKKND